MDGIAWIAFSMHLISAAVSFAAASYTYQYTLFSTRFFATGKRTPFLTLGLVALGVASLVDAAFLFFGTSTVLSLGGIIRMLALVYILGGAIILLRMVRGQEKGPEPEQHGLQDPPPPSEGGTEEAGQA